MKAQSHRLIHVKIYFCLIAASFILCLPQSGNAQQKKDTQPTPAVPSQMPQKNSGPGVDEQVIVNTDLISFNVIVTDTSGRFVSGLKKSGFALMDEKIPQEITFFSDEDAPVSVGILFDVSGSMSGEKIKRARDALVHFIQTSHEQDEYSLIVFNSRPQILIDKTRDIDAALSNLTSMQPQGNTALLDAVSLGVERVERGAHPKHALLLITDGGENDSRYSFDEVRRLLGESDVVLYSICVLDKIQLVGKAGGSVQRTLNELSKVSGGKAFYSQRSAEMDEDFERIALELRHQYSIGYKPRNFTSDGRWHRLKVRVTPPGAYSRLSVRSKEGYYALTTVRGFAHKVGGDRITCAIS